MIPAEGNMKKIFVVLLAVFFLLFGVNSALARHGNGHGKGDGHGGKGYSHSGSGYHGGHGGYCGKKYNSHGRYGGCSGKGKHHGGHGYHHYNYCGHGHHDDWYDDAWKVAAVGLGAAVVGSAIANSYYREPVTVVEHHTYYQPAPPPPCRVWVPGQYIYEGCGRYLYIPGHWR